MPIEGETWIRVRDKGTGHEYSVIAADEDQHEVLDEDAVDAEGNPLPAKPSEKAVKAAAKKAESAESKEK